jgi:HPt (histidine-containing phosphotransfer) domain-containing protein
MNSPDPPVLDAAQLSRRTMGDPHTRGEVLALFAAEVERLMRQVADAADPEIRGERLRALATAARNLGASRLAAAARTAESQIGETFDIAPLHAAVSETLAYLERQPR